MADDRIAKLSQRFSRHAVGRQPTATRSRERRSFYLDSELTERLDQAYRQLQHELYPRPLTKSVFLETVLEYGLAHLDELKALLAQAAGHESPDTPAAPPS